MNKKTALLAVGVGLLVASASLTLMRAGQTKAVKLTFEDYVEVQQLYHTYARAIDLGEGEKFASTFIQEGEFTGGRPPGRANDPRVPVKGHDGLFAIGDRSGLRHFTANLTIAPGPDGTVKGSCYLLLYSARTVPPSFVETAIYDDTLVKTAQGWKFKKRVVWRDDDDLTPFKPKPLRP
jgi:SnoaL-like domain